jgi:cytochrome c biogenesis protein CcmG, thiol:disulfide interchange protein DsbE
VTGPRPSPSGSWWSRPAIGPFTRRHLAILGAILLGAAAALVVLQAPVATTPGTALPTPGSGFYRLGEPTTGPEVGQRAPELEGSVDGAAVPLLDLDGEPIRLSDLRGRPVWLNFFATWCPPCQEETPVLREAYARYRDEGLELIAVSVQETTPEDIAAYAELYGLEFPIGFDATSAVFRAYGGFGLPTHVFIDREGLVRFVYYGPLRHAEADAILAPIVASEDGPSPEATAEASPAPKATDSADAG